MSTYSRTALSSGASLAQVITNVNTNTSAVAGAINNAATGGSSNNNLTSATVQRINMHQNGRAGFPFGDIFSTAAHVRKGGVVTKSSGRVYSIADGRWYPTFRGTTPFETYTIVKTSIANNSVTANKRTFLDMGYDGVIDHVEVALGANGPAIADGHIRFARISASASIATVTMLGDTVFASTSAYPTDFITGLWVIPSTSDPVNDVVIKSGLRCRNSTDTTNISVTSDLTVAADGTGANGLDTGAIANATTYHLFVISDSSGANSTAGLLSLSATAPTLPSGYDKFRRLRMIRRGTANWVRSATVDDETLLENDINVSSAFATTSWTAVNAATSLGLNGYPNLFAGVNLIMQHAGGGTSDRIAVASGFASPSTTASSLTGSYFENGAVETSYIGFVQTKNNSAGSFFMKLMAGSGPYSAIVTGWRERI